ncbi:MAG: FmdB family zinc ribbon protein [Phycisphaeraceae bacterium]
MPVYEYQCEDCGHVTEALRKMADADAKLACEKCGSNQTKRAHSVFSASSGESGGDLPIGPCGCACGDPNGPCNMG